MPGAKNARLPLAVSASGLDAPRHGPAGELAMRLIAATATPYRLPLRRHWQAACGGLSHRHGWLLCLRSDDGRSGYGDCAPLPSHGSEAPAAAGRALRRWTQALPGQTVSDALATLDAPDAGRNGFKNRNGCTPAARAAVECALLDLLAQAAGQALWHYLQAPQSPARPAPGIQVNASLGALAELSPSTLLAWQNPTEVGVCVAKIKLGLAPPAHEQRQLLALLAQTPASLQLRLDINRAWDEATATAFLSALPAERIEMVEEPLHASDVAAAARALSRLQAGLAFPLALDESWPDWPAATLFASPPPVRRLVLKLAACGGLLPALALARQARAAGMACVLSSGIDSACGLFAAAHLAAALDPPAGPAALAHGLATSCWLAADLGEPPCCDQRQLQLPERPGLGFVPYP